METIWEIQHLCSMTQLKQLVRFSGKGVESDTNSETNAKPQETNSPAKSWVGAVIDDSHDELGLDKLHIPKQDDENGKTAEHREHAESFRNVHGEQQQETRVAHRDPMTGFRTRKCYCKCGWLRKEHSQNVEEVAASCQRGYCAKCNSRNKF